MVAAPTKKLSSGHQMPLVGFGLWKVKNETCADQVYNAIKTGYRLLDGACDYGNEVECGQGVARAIKEGIVKREELFIVSKLWNTFHEEGRVEEACRRGLRDWGVGWFDLYIVHFPIALAYVDPATRYPPGFLFNPSTQEIRESRATIRETWSAMESLVDGHLTRSIGISNFQGSLIMDLMRHARIPPATLQIEHHPYLVQQPLLDLAKKLAIAVTAYSSFGPQSFLELDMRAARDAQPLLQHPTIRDIAERNGKSTAQVLLRWATQRGVAVIPKSNNQERLAANLDVCSFELGEEDLKRISGLDQGLRFNNPVNYGFDLPIFS